MPVNSKPLNGRVTVSKELQMPLDTNKSAEEPWLARFLIWISIKETQTNQIKLVLCDTVRYTRKTGATGSIEGTFRSHS